MTIPSFDADAKCPKCGSDDIGASYHADSSPWDGCRIRCPGRNLNDQHIIRHCRRCHYEWVEAPLDAKKPLKKFWGLSGNCLILPDSEAQQ